MSETFAFIDAEKAQYPIVKMCTWLDVSTSGFTSGATDQLRRRRNDASG